MIFKFSNLEAAIFGFDLGNLTNERNFLRFFVRAHSKGQALKLTVPITCDITPHAIFGYLLLPTRDIDVVNRTTI